MTQSVAFVGYMEGSAGQIHSWFESTGNGNVTCFIHPHFQLPELTKIERYISNFSYPENRLFKGVPLIVSEDWPNELRKRNISNVLITLADPSDRGRQIEKARNSNLKLVNAIHPSVTLLSEVILGENVIIHPKSLIGYRSEIDDGVMINIGSQIDHHCKLKYCSTIGSGVVMAGNVLIEDYAVVHTGAVIKNRVRVFRNGIMGAGAVAIEDVEMGTTVAGVPAKVIRVKDE